MGAIRTKSSLSQALMETAICYVAALTGAVYEWKAHSALAPKAGVSPEKLAKILSKEVEDAVFDETEKAVLAFTGQSTTKVAVDDAVFQKARECLGDDQKVMELTITVGGYNMVSRFLVGLDVTENNASKMLVPEPEL